MSEHIRPEIQALIDRGNVTSAENAELRCNSWEREALVPVLDDQAFVERMQYALDNCFTPQRRPFATYNDAVEGLFAPELLRRFAATKRVHWCECGQPWLPAGGLYGTTEETRCPGCVLREMLAASERAARDYAETIDGVREALGQKATHYLCVAGDVKELVEAIESRCDATVTLKRIRGESK